MLNKILLITPPFTQLNTPYPATPYLKGFLKSRGYEVLQVDLGIELMHELFSKSGFLKLFNAAKQNTSQLSRNSSRILNNEQHYLQTIDRVMSFLHYRDHTLAQRIASDHFLPRASRFDQLPDLEWSFGNIGVTDKARFFATLYIEDIGDLIRDAVTPYFGFSRYAEKLGMSAHSFAPIDQALHQPENIIEEFLLDLLSMHLEQFRPDVAGITIPFPGNLYGGLKCGQYIRNHYPHMTIVAGGGFVNTELRSLSEPSVFDYVDFLTLDDGERPFLNILKFLQGDMNADQLKRTFLRVDDSVLFVDDKTEKDFSHAETGCPDYSDLRLDAYLSLIEIANPMHRLWSDGQWNKITLAHGCYWHKCSFCDTALDYINRYDSASAGVLVDRIERIMKQTGQSGFHFVDEAAPPAVLRNLALELLRRKISISWWANIRFETAFTGDLCRLLAASGCIAATGGLEAASDRLLKLMHKGVTVRQAAQVCGNFSEAGIMVHAYLMYGFPTQTARETIDALEVVRQFFSEGLIQSAFWHLFTATIHSEVGMHPERYQCRVIDQSAKGFARNDLVHEDLIGCAHQAFAGGLNKAVYNFMHGIGTDLPVNSWFDFKTPAVSIERKVLMQAIRKQPVFDAEQLSSRILWLDNPPHTLKQDTGKKSAGTEKIKLAFYCKTEDYTLSVDEKMGTWLISLLERVSPRNEEALTLVDVKHDFEKCFSSPFHAFLKSTEWKMLRAHGLLLI